MKQARESESEREAQKPSKEDKSWYSPFELINLIIFSNAEQKLLYLSFEVCERPA